MNNDIILIILLILVAEAGIYTISSYSKRIRGLFEKIGVEVGMFIFLIKKRSALDILDRVRGRWINFLIWIGVAVMIISMILFYYGVYLLGLRYVIDLIKSLVIGERMPSSTPPITPIIPGVTISGVDILYIAIAIGIAAALHELGHAIAAKISNVNIKSYGVGIFLIMPLAFVEVDENSMLSSKIRAVKILSAGVLMNMILFIISFVLIISILFLLPFAGVIQGAVISQVEVDSPAYRAGISPGLLITSINGTPIYTLDNFLKFRSVIMSSENITLNISGIYPNGTRVDLLVYKPANTSRIGVVFDGLYIPLANVFIAALVKHYDNGYSRFWLLEDLLRLLIWINIINISFAVINAAPLYITDGGKFVSIIAPRRVSELVQIVTIAGFIMIFAASIINYI